MLPRRVHLSLVVLQLVSIATLLRSIAYDRWITVLASLFLLAGATAAQRGRTWGIGMALASASAFPVAFAIGIAPAWFCLVGLAGALPFALSWRPLARFDKGAATLLAAITATAGAAVAIAWKELAWSVFTTFPSLRPSLDAQHELAVAAILAVVAGVAASRTRPRDSSEDAHVRVAERVRIGHASEGEPIRAFEQRDALDDAVLDDDAPAPSRRRAHH